ncbi:hypothetical protein [Luteolibacter sp. LG18]|uniref:hypothetical protein n=1 Tax=Luteolibacter sp. LG18 TaxID=2819286 RepID=UPI002B2B0E95|nr:hypothetical protein llg_12590 [Luteolibacter sp. LG18]
MDEPSEANAPRSSPRPKLPPGLVAYRVVLWSVAWPIALITLAGVMSLSHWIPMWSGLLFLIGSALGLVEAYCIGLLDHRLLRGYRDPHGSSSGHALDFVAHQIGMAMVLFIAIVMIAVLIRAW